jgi:hypothetical protein
MRVFVCDLQPRKMAEALESKISTKSLYEFSVTAVVDQFLAYKKYLNYLPESVLFDVYYQVIFTVI